MQRKINCKWFHSKINIGLFYMFSLVTKISSIWVLIALTSIYKFFIHQIDVTNTFLNSDIE